MRHRAPRPFLALCRRLPRAAAHRFGGVVERGPVRVAVVLVAALGLGVGGYVASTVGGPTLAPPSSSALPSAAPGAGPSKPAEGSEPTAGRDPDVAGQEAGSGSPEGASTASGQPEEPASTSDAPPSVRRTLGEATDPPSVATSTPSTSPSLPDGTLPPTLDDLIPPITLLSQEFPEPDAAVFSLDSNERVSFTCSIDGSRYTSCGTPTRYSDLDPGWHTFAVRAVDDAGNVDGSPAATRWHATAGQSGTD